MRSKRKEEVLEAFKEFKKQRDSKKLILGLRKGLERYRKEEKKEKLTINLHSNPIMKKRDSNAKRDKNSGKSSPVQSTLVKPAKQSIQDQLSPFYMVLKNVTQFSQKLKEQLQEMFEKG